MGSRKASKLANLSNDEKLAVNCNFTNLASDFDAVKPQNGWKR